MTQTDHIFIIAEAGVNHDGSLDKALALVDVASDAGADAVKFQTFSADRLTTKTARKANYQTKQTGSSESQFEMLKRLELSDRDHRTIIGRCKERGIAFMSTPFDVDSLSFLVRDMGVQTIKLGSGEVTNGPLLLAAARTGLPVILSTGMTDLGEIEAALGVLAFGYSDSAAAPGLGVFSDAYASARRSGMLAEKVALLHCTTEYPAPFAEVNLNAMETMRRAFGLRVGYSDHTPGISVSIAAVAKGACIIEKHFTLSREASGPDHSSSLEPDELLSLVKGIREVEVAQGSGIKKVAESECENIAVARKVIVAANRIVAGSTFSPENLTVKRANYGLSPMRWWDIIRRRAVRDYEPDDVIDLP